MLRWPPDLKLTIRRVTRKTITEVLIEKEPAPPADEAAS